MIFLAQAIWRDVSIHNSLSVQHAVVSCGEPVHHAINSGDALIARSRSILATQFMQDFPEADVLVFIDGDIIFEVDDFMKIVEGARETGDIYGGIYVTRAREPHPASRTLFDQEWTFQRTPERRPQEVQYLATGFMAIPRQLLEDMADEGQSFTDITGGHCLFSYGRGANSENVIDFFRTFGIVEPDGVAHWLSEDWAFCERARQMGRKVWADQAVMLGHQGTITLTVADLNTPGQALSGPAAGGLTGATVQPASRELDPLVASLPADIAAWSGETEGNVRRMLPLGTAHAARLWQEHLKRNTLGDNGQIANPETVLEWYGREDVGTAYVMDLAHWHMNGAAEHFYEMIAGDAWVSSNELRIVDYGAGIGTLALMLARDGHTVQPYEPNRTLREFYSWRGARQERPPWTAVPLGAADLVIATHVFEHVGDVQAALEDLTPWLRPGGLLFYENDWVADEGHPQHFDHSATFHSALTAAGFESVDDHWARYVGITKQSPSREMAVEGGALSVS